MKTYIAILIGVVVLSGVVFGGYKFMQSRESEVVPKEVASVNMKTVTGTVIREYEGENLLEYSLEIPETATTSVDMDGALIRIVDSGLPYATIYISYEGGRGYGPTDYIGAIIAPHVSVINTTSVSKIGEYDWQGAESEGSEWHLASVVDGQWLAVVENKKTFRPNVEKTLESFRVK